MEGWAETSELSVIELGKRFEGAGVAAIIYTDIDRDGILKGINWASTLELAKAVSIPVIASGGLASMDDIRTLAQPEYRILEGAISGRAIYDGRIDSREALALLKQARGRLERRRASQSLRYWWWLVAILARFSCLAHCRLARTGSCN